MYFKKLQKTVAAELELNEANPEVYGLRVPQVPMGKFKRMDPVVATKPNSRKSNVYERQWNPVVAWKPNTRKSSVYDRQTYEEFATEVERRNRGSTLDKSIMDRAFKHAARQVDQLPERRYYWMLARVSRSSTSMRHP